jgi:phospholipase A1
MNVSVAQDRIPEPFNSDTLEYLQEQSVKKTIIYQKSQFNISDEEIKRALDAMPSFGVFRDTYFVTGIPLDEKTTRESADAMFQVSIRQRLTKSYLPFNTFLYATYTQKALWDIYSESSPFRDINFNPGIGLGRYIIYDNKLAGAVFMQLEHESNGKEELESRSWNYISFSGKYFLNPRFSAICKLWIPYVDGENNQDLLDYKGLGALAFNFLTGNNKWWIAAELNPRKGFGNVNTTVTAAYRVSKSGNQYLYARFYNGKGESLLNYSEYSMSIRIGVCVKPDFFSIY